MALSIGTGTQERGRRHQPYARVLWNFWTAVAETWPAAWELPPRKSRLTHGVGIVALGYVMDEITDRSSTEVDVPTAETYVKHLQPLVEICAWTRGQWDFGLRGPVRGTGFRFPPRNFLSSPGCPQRGFPLGVLVFRPPGGRPGGGPRPPSLAGAVCGRGGGGLVVPRGGRRGVGRVALGRSRRWAQRTVGLGGAPWEARGGRWGVARGSVRRPPGGPRLPARSRSLALQLARGRGSPPLRFASTRGPPSSTNTSQMFMARPGAERGAGASGQQQAEERVQECEGLGSEVARTGRWGRTRRWISSGLVVVRSDGRNKLVEAGEEAKRQDQPKAD